mgnify:CR=1 FL=1
MLHKVEYSQFFKNWFEFFTSTAYWKPLDCEAAVAEEPENPSFKKAYAPTINKEFAEYIPIKHSFSKQFERKAFSGMMEEPK